MFAVFFSYFIDLQVTAFLRDLCGYGQRFSGLYPAKDRFFKGIVIFRDAADTEGLQYDDIIVAGKKGEDIGLNLRSQL